MERVPVRFYLVAGVLQSESDPQAANLQGNRFTVGIMLGEGV